MHVTRALAPLLGLAALAALTLSAPAPAAAQQTLYVANYSNSTITKFTITDGAPAAAETFASELNGLNRPRGLAFDRAGNLFVTNYGDSNITKFTIDNTGALSHDGTLFANSGPSGLEDLAFDSAGNLFVTNYGDSSITKFTIDNTGALSHTGTLFANNDSNGLSSPRGLAFDSAGNLFAANFGNSTITKFAVSNGALSSANSESFASGLNGPFGLAFDSAGNLFASNINNSSITEFAFSNGALSHTGTAFASYDLNEPNGPRTPTGLAFDRAGNLFAANIGNGTITKFDSSSGAPESFAGDLSGPIFLTFAPTPEPAQAAFFGLGSLLLGGLVLRARRRTAGA